MPVITPLEGLAQHGCLELHLTDRCNLNCKYCYLNEGGGVRDRRDMSYEVIDQAIEMLRIVKQKQQADADRLLEAIAAALAGTEVLKAQARLWHKQIAKLRQDLPKPRITFYGGEPLLAFERLRYVVEKTKDLVSHWGVVSNGTIGTPEMVSFCKAHKIGVQRSHDGCPEAYECTRGKAALEAYNLRSPLWQDYGKTRRVTVEPETAHFLWEDFKYFEKMGLGIGATFIPNYYADWKPEQIEAFKKGLWRLAAENIRRFKTTRKGIWEFWSHRTFPTFSNRHGGNFPQGCGAGRGLWSIGINGDIFLCHRFASESPESECCYGNIRDVLAGTARGYGPIVRARFEEMDNNVRPAQCKRCVARPSCGDCCHHTNWIHSGRTGLTQPPDAWCELKCEAAEIVRRQDNELRQIDPRWYTKIQQQSRRPPCAAAAPIGTEAKPEHLQLTP